MRVTVKSMALELRPIAFGDACAFISEYHRHHKPPVGHKFSVACYDGNRLCGVATVGRPVSRYLDDGMTLEVNRLCTDGTKNACSLLYSASWRAAKALGYKRIYTYTLQSESGSSLRAAGWTDEGQAGGANWSGDRMRQEELFPELKTRWAKTLTKESMNGID